MPRSLPNGSVADAQTRAQRARHRCSHAVRVHEAGLRTSGLRSNRGTGPIRPSCITPLMMPRSTRATWSSWTWPASMPCTHRTSHEPLRRMESSPTASAKSTTSCSEPSRLRWPLSGRVRRSSGRGSDSLFRLHTITSTLTGKTFMVSRLASTSSTGWDTTSDWKFTMSGTSWRRFHGCGVHDRAGHLHPGRKAGRPHRRHRVGISGRKTREPDRDFAHTAEEIEAVMTGKTGNKHKLFGISS